MRKTAVDGKRDKAAVPAPSQGAGFVHNLRSLILGNLAGFVAAPVLGLFSGFLLLFGGIFLAGAWTAGPKPLLDARRYAPFTARAEGHVVESWTALEFDPSALPNGKLYWQPWSRISPCMVVEYAGDWGAPMQRAFCGNRFQFSDFFRFDDWHTLMPGVPFSFKRDANGFAVPEMRVGRAAFDWLNAHPPHDTFMLGKPPPATALGALREASDHPLDIALASWTTKVETVPLAYDPQHPEAPVPAKIVEDARRGSGYFAFGLIISVLFAVPGVFVFRIGIGLLTGQSGLLLWLLSLLPLLAMPWWGDLLPRLIAHANKQWADVAADMLDDIGRVTRFSASAPGDALLRGGERIVWNTSEGNYRDTFGQLHFTPPNPAPTSADAALSALRAQAATQVRALDSAQKTALFRRLRAQYEANRQNVQRLFTTAAEDTLRDADADAGAHKAARNFLIFASGGTYYEDQLDKIEASPRALSAPSG
ncbi:MAG: hypothetical protein QM741_17550 [Rudaea sp.]|uniref:hypothetical protein n=1 Tax=Rudaea sp. TaxID=2136325 RepID=UPI0039E54A66